MTRGRKRKSGKRERNGRLQRNVMIDRGTNELRNQRERLSGDANVPGDWPLDVLRALGLITAEQATAGHNFAVLRWKVYGSPKWQAEIYKRLVAQAEASPGIPTDDVEIGRAVAYGRLVGMLKSVGDYATHLTMRTCVYLELPGWARKNQPLTTLAGVELAALKNGLSALMGEKLARAA